MTDATVIAHAPRFWGYSLYGGLLAMAGLPIYIHAPYFYVEQYGVALGLLGTVLFVLRGLDFVQDPALGWLAARLGARRGQATALAVVACWRVPWSCCSRFRPVLAAGVVCHCHHGAVHLPILSDHLLLRHRCRARGDAGAGRACAAGRVARKRGACRGLHCRRGAGCAGKCHARALHRLCAGLRGGGARGGLGHAAEWPRFTPDLSAVGPFREVLSDPTARRLLTVALVNATPVAITSTLFLFYAEAVLQTDGAEGPLLILLFLAAAASAPVWAQVAKRLGAKTALLVGMALAMASFAFVLTLGPGDLTAFAVICVVSGAGMGADLTLAARHLLAPHGGSVARGRAGLRPVGVCDQGHAGAGRADRVSHAGHGRVRAGHRTIPTPR